MTTTSASGSAPGAIVFRKLVGASYYSKLIEYYQQSISLPTTGYSMNVGFRVLTRVRRDCGVRFFRGPGFTQGRLAVTWPVRSAFGNAEQAAEGSSFRVASRQ